MIFNDLQWSSMLYPCNHFSTHCKLHRPEFGIGFHLHRWSSKESQRFDSVPVVVLRREVNGVDVTLGSRRFRKCMQLQCMLEITSVHPTSPLFSQTPTMDLQPRLIQNEHLTCTAGDLEPRALAIEVTLIFMNFASRWHLGPGKIEPMAKGGITLHRDTQGLYRFICNYRHWHSAQLRSEPRWTKTLRCEYCIYGLETKHRPASVQ